MTDESAKVVTIIEEAWEGITEAALCLHHGDKCHPFKEAWGDLEEGIVALALAVLEAAFSLPEPPLLGTIEINLSEREAVLRAAIEALGR